MKESINHGFSFGNVNNFYDDNHKKRDLEDIELETPPAKRYNSANPSSEASTDFIQSDSPLGSPAYDYLNDQYVDLSNDNDKPNDLAEHQPTDSATDQPTINCQDDIWALLEIAPFNDDSLHKYTVWNGWELYNVEVTYNATTATLLNCTTDNQPNQGYLFN